MFNRTRMTIARFVLVIAVLPFLAADAFAQAKPNPAPCEAANPGPAGENLAHAMRVSARDIDASLPAQCVADWLTTALNSKGFEWSLMNCTKTANPKQAKNPENKDMPK
jgi:hypothetical protein